MKDIPLPHGSNLTGFFFSWFGLVWFGFCSDWSCLGLAPHGKEDWVAGFWVLVFSDHDFFSSWVFKGEKDGMGKEGRKEMERKGME